MQAGQYLQTFGSDGKHFLRWTIHHVVECRMPAPGEMGPDVCVIFC